jgi:hypothetical protein
MPRSLLQTTTSLQLERTPNLQVNTSCTWKGKPRNYTLDSNSHCWDQEWIWSVHSMQSSTWQCLTVSFHNGELCTTSELSTTQTPASVRGISNVNTATQHSVSLQLRSRHTDWHVTIDCSILPNINGATPFIKLNTSSWNIPKDVRLADEQFNQPGGIDLLIGADLFYEMLLRNKRTRPSKYPVLQETVLGQYQVELQPSLQHAAHNTCLCFKKTTVWSKEGGIYIAAHHIQLLRRKDPTQGLRLHLVKVPSLQHCQHPHQGGRCPRS